MLTRRAFLPALAVLMGLYSSGRAWAESSPKIEILLPAGDAALAGTVEVRIKVAGEGQTPSQFQAGFGGPPSVEMAKAEGADEWAATIDTTLVPNGSRQLTIVSANRKVGAAKDVTIANPLNVYFADLHSHTAYSDGTLTPAAAHEYARDVAKLDVFSLCDHLESVDDTEWSDTREVAWDFNVSVHRVGARFARN